MSAKCVELVKIIKNLIKKLTVHPLTKWVFLI
nr:MAG TPA: hypothetical protein [Caudoviricetes sp.]DAT69733.1 MAG TPA: hypothetical protein [Caudoviricetes sp.]